MNQGNKAFAYNTFKVIPFVSFFLLTYGFLYVSAKNNYPGRSRSMTVDSVKKDTNKVSTGTQNYPDFPGGLVAFNKFIADHTSYPASAKEKSIIGIVTVSFTVEKDGSLSKVHVIQGIGGGCDEEAVKVIKSLPKFTPAMKNGKTVRSTLAVPVSFWPTAVDPRDPIFKTIDTYPQFPGGPDSLGHFLAHKVNYPLLARQNDIQGKVMVSFVVEKDGTLSDFHVVRGIGYGCDEAAVAAMALSPNWIPGKKNGAPVQSRFSVPISFTLSD